MLKMMTVLALVMLTSAAPAGGDMTHATHDDHDRKLGWSWGETETLMAKFNVENPLTHENLFSGSVKVTQMAGDDADARDKTQAKWKLNLKVDYEALCGSSDNELKWHIHDAWGLGYPNVGPDDSFAGLDKATPGQCGGGATKGHYDPTYACGGASSGQSPNDDGVCASIASLTNRPKIQTCDLLADASTCEYGDLNGKMGNAKVDADGFVKGTTQGNNNKDYNIGNIDNIKGKSIVFHCASGERIACAQLNVESNTHWCPASWNYADRHHRWGFGSFSWYGR